MSAVENLPKPIATIASMMNTTGLAMAAGLGSWLIARGLASDLDSVGLADVARVAELRDGLRRWVASGGAPHPQVVEMLNRAARTTPLRLAVDESGLTSVEPAALSPVDRAIGEVLAAIHDAVAAGLWDRLKVCRDPACGWVFYDRSRNRSGVWCDMAVCGNRAKARNYRARRRVTGS